MPRFETVVGITQDHRAGDVVGQALALPTRHDEDEREKLGDEVQDPRGDAADDLPERHPPQGGVARAHWGYQVRMPSTC